MGAVWDWLSGVTGAGKGVSDWWSKWGWLVGLVIGVVLMLLIFIVIRRA